MKLDIFKPYGKTPKDILDEYKSANPSIRKMAFSCRLDPMACGIMPIFTDEDCLKANECNGADKTYRFIAIFGIETSSSDLLGDIKKLGNYSRPDSIDIIRFLDNCVENYDQTLPVHSSYVVRNESGEKGPLWWWAKHNRLDQITIPSFKRELYKWYGVNWSVMTLHQIAKIAIERISLINPKHDFNQNSILEQWRRYLGNQQRINVLEMFVDVSSGFYVRKLVEDMGYAVGIPTTTLEIERVAYFLKK